MSTVCKPLRRVACLYRVSTKRQVEENDIPLQKNACRAFIGRMEGWVLTEEYTEKGVSGYHKSAGQRDILQKARRDAEQGLFDILLVFMFDRLGRREDETPFIVEWFVQQGVAVWSVTEGEQRFDNRVDKLLNYIRFWQSGGESEKTSLRVREKHRQMTEDGLFRGGDAPFGYQLMESGRRNNKGYPLKKLAIDETESGIIRTIFRLAAEQGYGGRRIAGYLNERGILTGRGGSWSPAAAMDILKNPIYMGRYVSGRRRNTRGKTQRMPQSEWIFSREIHRELVIVDEDLWYRAERIRASRTKGGGRYPLQTCGALLLTGLLQCGVCGGRMTSRHEVRHWVRKKDGEPITTHREAYRCANRYGHEGQKTYGQQKIDPMVTGVLLAFLARLPAKDLTAEINTRLCAAAAENEAAMQQHEKLLHRAEMEYARLKREIGRRVEGESLFNENQWVEIMQAKEEDIAHLTALQKSREATRELFHTRWEAFKHQQKYDASKGNADRPQGKQTNADTPPKKQEKVNTLNGTGIINWQTVFSQMAVSAQKMLLAAFLQRVTVERGMIKIYCRFDPF